MLAAAAAGLAGCGVVTPNIKEPLDQDFPAVPGGPNERAPRITGTTQIEYEIRKRIQCDLKEAVQEANTYSSIEIASLHGPDIGKPKPLVPMDWGATVALSLEVDEFSALNPGVSFNTTYPNLISYPAAATALGAIPATLTPQSFNFGFGGTLSSTATRTDTFNPYYSVKFLMKPNTPDSVCVSYQNDPFVQNHQTPATSSPLIIESDLGIKDWLVGSMFTTTMLPPKGQSPGKPPIQYEIKFVIITSANATPTWKLVRVSANAGGPLPLFSTGRTRTHDLIITLGPVSGATRDAHLAAQIGNAVGNANRTSLPPR